MKSSKIFYLLCVVLLVSCETTSREYEVVMQSREPKNIDAEAKSFYIWMLTFKECQKSYTLSEFNCQVLARESAILFWIEHKVQGYAHPGYLGDIEKIYLAGYMREYVWVNVMRKRESKPDNLRLSAYSKWESLTIPNHTAIVR